MATRVGGAYIDIRANNQHLRSDLDAAYGQISSSASAMQSSISKAFKIAAIAATASIAAITYAMSNAINVASELEETVGKFNVVFAQQRKEAEAMAKVLTSSYAMSSIEAKKYLANVQDLLVPMGMAADSAIKMSFGVAKLSADLASFNNMKTADVINNIQSALTGEYESMKKYGVILNSTVIQQEAMNKGLWDGKGALDANVKAQVAFELITRMSTAAIGDQQRTMGSYANQMKLLDANIISIKAAIGEQLLPAATQFINKMNEWIKANNEFLNQKIPETITFMSDALFIAIEAMSSLIRISLAALPLIVIHFGLVGKAIISANAALYAFNMSFLTVNASAALATGGVVALTAASGLLFAAYAGWEIGTFLNKFETIQLAGLAFTDGIISGWIQIKAAFKFGGLAIQNSWWRVINGIREKWIDFLELVANTASYVPGVKKITEPLLESVRVLRLGIAAGFDYEAESKKITETKNSELKAHNDTIESMRKGITEGKKITEVVKPITDVGNAVEDLTTKTRKAAEAAAKLRTELAIDLQNRMAEAMPDNYDADYGSYEEDLVKRVEEGSIAIDNYFSDLEKSKIEAAEKSKKAEEEALKETTDAYKDFSDTVQDFTADILNDWDNAWDSMKDIMKRTLSEMAAELLSKKLIIPIAMSIGSNLGMSWGGTSFASMQGLSGGGGGFGLMNGLGFGKNAYGIATTGQDWLWQNAGLMGPSSSVVASAAAAQTAGQATWAAGMGNVGAYTAGGTVPLGSAATGGAGGFMSTISSALPILGAFAAGVALLKMLKKDDPPTLAVYSERFSDDPMAAYKRSGAGIANAGEGWDISAWADIGDIGSDARSSVSNSVVNYLTSKFEALDEGFEWSLKDVINKGDFATGTIDLRRYDLNDSEAVQRLFSDISRSIFDGVREDLLKAAFGELPTYKKQIVDEVYVASTKVVGVEGDRGQKTYTEDILETRSYEKEISYVDEDITDFFETLSESGDAFEGFYNFNNTLKNVDGGLDRFINQMGYFGLSIEDTYSNFEILGAIFDQIDTSLQAIYGSSTLNAIENLDDAWDNTIETLKEAKATTKELEQAEKDRYKLQAAAILNISADRIQTAILGGEKITDILRASMANIASAQLSEQFMASFIDPLLDDFGKALKTGDIETILASMTGVIMDVEGGSSELTEAYNRMLVAIKKITGGGETSIDAAIDSFSTAFVSFLDPILKSLYDDMSINAMLIKRGADELIDSLSGLDISDEMKQWVTAASNDIADMRIQMLHYSQMGNVGQRQSSLMGLDDEYVLSRIISRYTDFAPDLDLSSLEGMNSLINRAGTASYPDLINFSQIEGISIDDLFDDMDSLAGVIRTTSDTFEDLLDAMRDFRNDLSEETLSGLPPAVQFAESKNILQSTYQSALTGDAAALEAFPDVARNFLDLSKTTEADMFINKQNNDLVTKMTNDLTSVLEDQTKATEYISEEEESTTIENFTALNEGMENIKDGIRDVFQDPQAVAFFKNFEAVFGTNPFIDLQAGMNTIIASTPDLSLVVTGPIVDAISGLMGAIRSIDFGGSSVITDGGGGGGDDGTTGGGTGGTGGTGTTVGGLGYDVSSAIKSIFNQELGRDPFSAGAEWWKESAISGGWDEATLRQAIINAAIENNELSTDPTVIYGPGSDGQLTSGGVTGNTTTGLGDISSNFNTVIEREVVDFNSLAAKLGVSVADISGDTGRTNVDFFKSMSLDDMTNLVNSKWDTGQVALSGVSGYMALVNDLDQVLAGQGYADGGISTGPSSGYPTMLHGTEAIIPLKGGGIPVNINSNQSTKSIVDEIKSLKEENAEIVKYLYQITKNTKKSYDISDKWDEEGIPAERVI